MDEVTRKYALQKIDAMKHMVAYPDELMNDSLIEQYYNDLKISPDQFFQNILNIRFLSHKNEISQLREPVINGRDWKLDSKSIAIINALYVPSGNRIGNEDVFLIHFVYDSGCQYE